MVFVEVMLSHVLVDFVPHMIARFKRRDYVFHVLQETKE